MDYLNKALMNGERIIYRSRPHWVLFLPALVWFGITLVFSYLIPKNVQMMTQILLNLSPYQIIMLATMIITVLVFVSGYINFAFTEFTITNKRILMKTGLIQRNIVEILLTRVESIIINQNVGGRLLDYGSITLVGTGGSRDPFNFVPQPLKFRSYLEQEIANTQPAPQKQETLNI
jgi:uncharacterized membrane protein YdbT with pleckstrin-like domain